MFSVYFKHEMTSRKKLTNCDYYTAFFTFHDTGTHLLPADVLVDLCDEIEDPRQQIPSHTRTAIFINLEDDDNNNVMDVIQDQEREQGLKVSRIAYECDDDVIIVESLSMASVITGNVPSADSLSMASVIIGNVPSDNQQTTVAVSITHAQTQQDMISESHDVSAESYGVSENVTASCAATDDNCQQIAIDNMNYNIAISDSSHAPLSSKPIAISNLDSTSSSSFSSSSSSHMVLDMTNESEDEGDDGDGSRLEGAHIDSSISKKCYGEEISGKSSRSSSRSSSSSSSSSNSSSSSSSSSSNSSSRSSSSGSSSSIDNNASPKDTSSNYPELSTSNPIPATPTITISNIAPLLPTPLITHNTPSDHYQQSNPHANAQITGSRLNKSDKCRQDNTHNSNNRCNENINQDQNLKSQHQHDDDDDVNSKNTNNNNNDNIIEETPCTVSSVYTAATATAKDINNVNEETVNPPTTDKICGKRGREEDEVICIGDSPPRNEKIRLASILEVNSNQGKSRFEYHDEDKDTDKDVSVSEDNSKIEKAITKETDLNGSRNKVDNNNDDDDDDIVVVLSSCVRNDHVQERTNLTTQSDDSHLTLTPNPTSTSSSTSTCVSFSNPNPDPDLNPDLTLEPKPVQELLDGVTAVHREDGRTVLLFILQEVIEKSGLISLLDRHLRNESLLDIENHSELYYLIFQVCVGRGGGG